MKNIPTYQEYINESKKDDLEYDILDDFINNKMESTHEYELLMTNSTLDGHKTPHTITGEVYADSNYGHMSDDKSEVDDNIKAEKPKVLKKLKLLQRAVDEYNKKNNTILKLTYKLNSPKAVKDHYDGETVYKADNLTGHIVIKN